jgi:hypothetical protein
MASPKYSRFQFCIDWTSIQNKWLGCRAVFVAFVVFGGAVHLCWQYSVDPESKFGRTITGVSWTIANERRKLAWKVLVISNKAR